MFFPTEAFSLVFFSCLFISQSYFAYSQDVSYCAGACWSSESTHLHIAWVQLAGIRMVKSAMASLAAMLVNQETQGCGRRLGDLEEAHMNIWRTMQAPHIDQKSKSQPRWYETTMPNWYKPEFNAKKNKISKLITIYKTLYRVIFNYEVIYLTMGFIKKTKCMPVIASILASP